MSHQRAFSILITAAIAGVIACGKAENVQEGTAAASHKIWTNKQAVANSVMDSTLLAPDISTPALADLALSANLKEQTPAGFAPGRYTAYYL